MSKIYQHQGRYDKAEKVLLESLEIDEENFHAMAELISIYDKNSGTDICFRKLDEFLEGLDVPGGRKPQAMFNNLFKLCSNRDRPEKAREYFERYSYMLDERNVSLYRRYFGWE